MRLLRALRRCAAPGSIPQQVDFYSRFSPSPLSMKQFLDFGESPPGSPRPGPSAGCRAPRCPRAFVPLRGRARSEPLGPLGSAACPRRPLLVLNAVLFGTKSLGFLPGEGSLAGSLPRAKK